MAQKAKATARKKRVKKNIASGVAHVHSTFNNTIVTITDEAGNVIQTAAHILLSMNMMKPETSFHGQVPVH